MDSVEQDANQGTGSNRRLWWILAAVALSVVVYVTGPRPWADAAPALLLERDGVSLISGSWPDEGVLTSFVGSGVDGEPDAGQEPGAPVAVADDVEGAPQDEGAPSVGAQLLLRPAAAWSADRPARVCVQGGDGSETLRMIDADGRATMLPISRTVGEDGCAWAELQPPTNARLALAIMALIVMLLVVEAIPLHLTALLVPVLVAGAGILSAKLALAPFFHPTIALFLAGFVISEALHQCGLDRLMALRLVKAAGRSPFRVFAALTGSTAFLSMWMSNTAAMAVALPIVMAVTAPMRDDGFRRAMILASAYAATIGGIGSAIGTPSNPLAMAYLSQIRDEPVVFVDWFWFGLPFVVLFLPIMGAIVWGRASHTIEKAAFETAMLQLDATDRRRGLSATQWKVLAVFLGVILLWFTEEYHGLEAGLCGLAGVVLLGTLNLLDRETFRHISWESLLVFGGGLCLGDALVASGASDWIATRLAILSVLPPGIAVGLVGLLTLVLSAVASNTAAAATILPLTIPLAVVIGVNPTQLIVTVAIASSIDFALVVGTPPTMIAYSTGLYTSGYIFRRGIILDIIGLGILILLLPLFWQWFGVL
jgi:solute carrier family 13 (sodium-dependent dicarboxylate transporter), member 2/3/5